MLLEKFNTVLLGLIALAYVYQMIYFLVGLFIKPREKEGKTAKLHKYAVFIAARNEEAVISYLIQSIKAQNYPQELVDIYVVSDNSTDNTAAVAREAGAIVYERQNKNKIGKGYALEFIFNVVQKRHADKNYDGYFIIDADNLLDKNYIAEMNKVFDSGYKIVTSFRNSKNFDSNWISAGSALWFLRESLFINNPRMIIKNSCAVSGTGFLVSSDIINKNGGWKYHMLTEDIEFSIDSIVKGETIGYCGTAILYDEQPRTWKQSYNQRLRWSKGFYQVFSKDYKELIKGMFKKGGFTYYDMFMTIEPALLITSFVAVANILVLLYGIIFMPINSNVILIPLEALISYFVNYYLSMLAIGAVVTISAWKKIKCVWYKKIAYTITFPIFLVTNLPIAFIAFFRNVKWDPIIHDVSIPITHLSRQG